MSWDKVWEDVFRRQQWGKYPSESIVRFTAKNFYNADRKNTRILEVGCGPGVNIWYFSREGFDTYGIDGSAAAIDQARSRLSQDGLKADLWIGDIINLPYGDNYFDLVVDAECLYCNSRKDTENILGEIKRVLKKRGLFYSQTFAGGTYLGKYQDKLSDFEYRDISDGPFQGKGFVRLTDRDEIVRLYGLFFEIKSIDRLERSLDNGRLTVSEWISVCGKKD